MTAFTKFVVTAGCNLIQWAIDNDPAPNTDKVLTKLRTVLKEEKEELKEAVAEDG